MKYLVEYAVQCHTGKVRSKNQDNFWCAWKFLECQNDGLKRYKTGTLEVLGIPAFAVFDGMGGEQQGEVAAYLASKSFDLSYRADSKNDIKKFLLDTCVSMNNAVCNYAKENKVKSMGSTAAMVVFGREEIYICNIGDSRIYQKSEKQLTQISLDHCEKGSTQKKPPLTQSLGIPENEFLIEPYIAMGHYGAGDRYLLCSDGLTDMVSDKEIAEILISQRDVVRASQSLINLALNKGGVDNVTVIICEVKKQNSIMNRFKIRRDGENRGDHRK